MKNKIEKVVCVYDDGICLSVAHKLAEDFEKVYYFNPWKSAFPTISDMSIGKGYSDFEKIDNFWDYIEEIDIVVFTGILDGDLQMYLEKIGKGVWGSREGEMLEVDRLGFLQHLKELGLNIPKTELISGLDNLQKKLEKEDNLYIKVDSTTRGSFETFFHKTWNTTRPLIEKLRHNFGPLANEVTFNVQEPIDGDLEYGFDTYMVAGEFPEEVMYGFEIKELGYVCKVIEFSEMDAEIIKIFEKLKPTFKHYNYTGPFSAELRKDKSGKFYFTDACCRCANPATYVMMLLCENYSEIVNMGVEGIMVQPKWNAKYGGEVTINSEFIMNEFGELFYPDKLKPFMNRMNCCMVDGSEWQIPNGHFARKLDSYGSVASIDNDPEKMLEVLKDRIKMIDGYKVNIDNKNLEEALEKLTE